VLVLDKYIVEEIIEESENTLDDTLILPAIEAIRALNGIPDYPDSEARNGGEE